MSWSLQFLYLFSSILLCQTTRSVMDEMVHFGDVLPIQCLGTEETTPNTIKANVPQLNIHY